MALHVRYLILPLAACAAPAAAELPQPVRAMIEAAIGVFRAACRAAIAWIFRTGYRLKS